MIEQLQDATSSVDTFTDFIESNSGSIQDYFLGQEFSALKNDRVKIRAFINNQLQFFKKLDFNKEQVRIFLSILLDVAERFSFPVPFQRLYKTLERHDCEISRRSHAAALFLIRVRSLGDLSARLKPILDELNSAIEEEDSEKPVVATALNYYAEVVRNYAKRNQKGVSSIREELVEFSKSGNYLFLNVEVVGTVLSIDVSDHIDSYESIQSHIDEYLSRATYYSTPSTGFLIEDGTEYSKKLSHTSLNFVSIRQLSVVQAIDSTDNKVFYSLGRGVSVLESEEQLHTYMRSYGNMHYHKMVEALSHLPDEIKECEISLVDWGCGQALASMIFLEQFGAVNASSKIKSVVLVEPSEIALRRGALHVTKFYEGNVITVNKELDEVDSVDFSSCNKGVVVHLFSNILDVNHFSLNRLIDMVNSSFSGTQYFVCVSPMISERKTARLDNFLNAFSHSQDYRLLNEENDGVGDWKRNWTRVERVFSAII